MKSLRITQSITNRQDTSLNIFLKELSKRPLLSVEEEVELYDKIKDGDTSATNKLVEGNLRFVVSVAKQYQNKGLPLIDLIQSGVEGAIKAASLWDASRGFKFISYAVWWIRQYIIQAISSECRTVRVPMNQVVNMNKINKASEKLEQELGRSPSTEELEIETELSSDKINLTLSAINRSLSLDMPFKDEETNSLLDVIPNGESSESNIIKESISKEIDLILKKLSNRESDVIRMSFGIGIPPMSLDEIGVRFGLGSERIRQLQRIALEKLKQRFGNKLKELL